MDDMENEFILLSIALIILVIWLKRGVCRETDDKHKVKSAQSWRKEAVGNMKINDYADIFDYWQDSNLTRLEESCFEQDVHKEDLPFLTAKMAEEKGAKLSFDFKGRIPSPWDGNLKSAKIVICYANPLSDVDDVNNKAKMLKQLSGSASLPTDIRAWNDWYEEKKFGRLGAFKNSNTISVFNVCPYASENMSDINWRVASCLPSVWWAQKHLREVLIPMALDKEIFLVIARAHKYWGISSWDNIDLFKEGNIRIQTNRGGFIKEDVARDFIKWEGSS
jgi:hypothetical protein